VQQPVFTDIADIFEAAEQAEALTPKPRRTRRTKAKPIEAEAAATDAPSTIEPSATPQDGSPSAVNVADTEAHVVNEGQAASGAVVQPVLIGAGETPTAVRKRGWWKRPA
jgi:ribonuclease E